MTFRAHAQSSRSEITGIRSLIVFRTGLFGTVQGGQRQAHGDQPRRAVFVGATPVKRRRRLAQILLDMIGHFAKLLNRPAPGLFDTRDKLWRDGRSLPKHISLPALQIGSATYRAKRLPSFRFAQRAVGHTPWSGRLGMDSGLAGLTLLVLATSLKILNVFAMYSRRLPDVHACCSGGSSSD